MTAVGIIWLRDLIAVVMLSGIYSLLTAGLFVIMGAPDVALTEAAVGAGMATVLMLGTVALTSRSQKPTKMRIVPISIVVVTGAVLIYGTLSLPRFGDPDAPAQVHVAPRYLEEAPAATGSPNVVTAVLASYRGWDTLGEAVVIFAAGMSVLLLLGSWRRSSKKEGE